MPRFDLDTQRAVVCMIGVMGLMMGVIGFFATGKSLPPEMIGAFTTMAAGPPIGGTIGRYLGNRNDPPPPPSFPPPASEDDGEKFYRQHGYYEMNVVLP